MNARVQPAPGVGRNKPLCEATVRVSEKMTITRAQRELEARLKHRAVEVCARRATHMVDGRPLCLAHAGLAALAILQRDVGS